MKQVYWSQKATSDYWKNIDYLLEYWDLKVAHAFIDKTNHTIDLIQKSPEAFPETDYKNIRRAIIVPQITLFYRLNFNDDSIDLLRFWSNFQNPDSISF
ncbi:type II toxin-antitoxin system RelE/ParE family toxin [Rhodohalobacter sp. SW132]|uniref:type II toxin-antitoxin system RelE/ParE family toxin n=1 Tax=Rhodohalobacter sp. SW132 TaxID=2293433 RepID=UPI000E24BE0D|nr:type II toxin-antitoxin system RelE/ParE family toxin [Rhodohalobacter sp. SW132]REL32858.1 type II toxin-antitoxin system RelE/ParE family toxin [Rhodohalobacter sp. SW132]